MHAAEGAEAVPEGIHHISLLGGWQLSLQVVGGVTQIMCQASGVCRQAGHIPSSYILHRGIPLILSSFRQSLLSL
jgi:hypothetical protein